MTKFREVNIEKVVLTKGDLEKEITYDNYPPVLEGFGLPYEKIEVTVEIDTPVLSEYIGTPVGCSTEIIIRAIIADVDGDAVLDYSNGTNTIADIISLWNADNVDNQIELISGDDTQVPDNEVVIELTGGTNGAPNSIRFFHSLDSDLIRVTFIGTDNGNKLIALFSYYSDGGLYIDGNFINNSMSVQNITTSSFDLDKDIYTFDTGTHTILIEKLN